MSLWKNSLLRIHSYSIIRYLCAYTFIYVSFFFDVQEWSDNQIWLQLGIHINMHKYRWIIFDICMYVNKKLFLQIRLYLIIRYVNINTINNTILSKSSIYTSICIHTYVCIYINISCIIYIYRRLLNVHMGQEN
jgi:hypothetical protein